MTESDPDRDARIEDMIEWLRGRKTDDEVLHTLFDPDLYEQRRLERTRRLFEAPCFVCKHKPPKHDAAVHEAYWRGLLVHDPRPPVAPPLR